MTVSRLTAVLAVAVVLLVPQLGVSAEEDGDHMGGPFKKADKDGDGSLTREEAKAVPRVSKNFDAIDVDKSGTVTRKEIGDFMKAHRQERKKD
jgi:Ca2+-binding EF-hand superfamily protein